MIDALDINDMTPLMWAAIEGHTEVTTVLLKAGKTAHCDVIIHNVNMT